MARNKYSVRMPLEQRLELQPLIRVGKQMARAIAMAWILLKSDEDWPDPQSVDSLDLTLSPVCRVKHRFAEEVCLGSEGLAQGHTLVRRYRDSWGGRRQWVQRQKGIGVCPATGR